MIKKRQLNYSCIYTYKYYYQEIVGFDVIISVITKKYPFHWKLPQYRSNCYALREELHDMVILVTQTINYALNKIKFLMKNNMVKVATKPKWRSVVVQSNYVII